MVEDAFYIRFFIVDAIVSDDDSTMRYVLNNPSQGAQGKVMNSYKGKLDEEIPEPLLLADTSYRVKVFDKHIFSIFNESRAHRYGCTKAYILRLNKYWGYTIKKNREK